MTERWQAMVTMEQIRHGAHFLCPTGACGEVCIRLGPRSGARGHRVLFACPHVVRCSVCGKSETQLNKRRNAADQSVVVCLVTLQATELGSISLSCHHAAIGKAVTGAGERLKPIPRQQTLLEEDIAFLADYQLSL